MADVLFSWVAPTTREDGSPLPDDLVYRLYENDQLAVDDIAETNFTLINAAEESNEYYVTTYLPSSRQESPPSAKITINLVKPNAPTDFSYSVG